MAQFVDGVCKRDAEARSTVADVFAAYLDWALTNDIKQTMSKKGLWERLTRLSFGSHKDRTARYVYWPARAKLAVTHAGRYFSKYPTAVSQPPFHLSWHIKTELSQRTAMPSSQGQDY